jgi:phage baseplate assembly protein W
MANVYKGFSTLNRNKKFRVSDFELVKQDLYNHFQIRKGEKLMQPNFGSVVWNFLFEPLTEQTKTAITEDVKSVVGYDPRTKVSNVIVTQFEHGIQIEIELLYVTENLTDQISFTFDSNSMTLTRS